ncbi:MAG TPA: hypothetical protein VGK32_15475 [Vicinamibacterales bacterium]
MHCCSWRRLGCVSTTAAALILWLAGTVAAQGLPSSLAGYYAGTASSSEGDLAVVCELKKAG